MCRRLSWTMRGLVFAAIVVLIAIPGCAVRRNPNRTAELPLAWRGRTLYDTPSAFIYASSADTADEIERLLIAVGREFEQNAGQPPSKGLVIVTDHANDTSFVDDDAFFDIVTRGASTSMRRPIASDLDEVYELSDLQALTEHGIAPREIQNCATLPLAVADVRAALGVVHDANSVGAWAVAVPTEAACRLGALFLVQATLDRAGVKLSDRVLIAPWMIWFEDYAGREFLAGREYPLYERLVLAAPFGSAD